MTESSGASTVLRGSVQTVLGVASPQSLGTTLAHEHLYMHYDTTAWQPGAAHSNADCCFSLENLDWIRQHPYWHRDNLVFSDNAVQAAVRDELAEFRRLGGGCMVEVTSHGLGRGAAELRDLSRHSGVNIICGTGHYVGSFQSSEGATVEQMTDVIISDVTRGCAECPEVKAGVIGEVGSNWPINEFERRAIEAAAVSQRATGAPVSFHPGRDADSPAEIVRLFQEAGGDASHAAMGHLDRTVQTESGLLELADTCGCYLEFDLFGIESSYYQLSPQTEMPSDSQRLRRIQLLVQHGFTNRLLLSHDIHTKHRLKKFGGHGFSHLLENIVPWMKQRHFTDDHVHSMLVDNPHRWLTFV